MLAWLALVVENHVLRYFLKEFYLHDAQLVLGVAAVLGFEEVEFTCGRFCHLYDTSESILVLAGTT